MILPIYLYGQPVLRRVAADITPDYPNLRKLVDDMFETMDQADGIGLAAPQIGLSIRVLVINLDALSDNWPEYKNYRKAMINAHIVETEGEPVSREEGCLSVPGIHESVVRQERLLIRYCDVDFVERTELFEGYVARVIQHEYDHLDGKVFVDRISPIRKQLIKSKLHRIVQGEVSCDYRVKRVNPRHS